MKTCKHCGTTIPQERLDVLPETEECVRCSTEPQYFAVLTYDHKTAGYVQYVKEPEHIRQAKRFVRRAR